MTPDATIPLDRAHYDMIVATATRTGHIEEKVDDLADRFDALANKVDILIRQLGECPCPSVTVLQDQVATLRDEANVAKGRFSIVQLLVTAGASAGGGGGVSMLLLKILGGGGNG